MWTLFLIPELFRTLTGLTIEQFNTLVDDTKDYVLQICIETGKPMTRRNGKKRELDIREQLLMCLIWMRQYIVVRFIAWLFGISHPMVVKYNAATINGLYRYFNSRIFIPEFPIREQNGAMLRRALITIVIDGTEQEVKTPLKRIDEKSLYSGTVISILLTDRQKSQTYIYQVNRLFP